MYFYCWSLRPWPPCHKNQVAVRRNAGSAGIATLNWLFQRCTTRSYFTAPAEYGSAVAGAPGTLHAACCQFSVADHCQDQDWCLRSGRPGRKRRAGEYSKDGARGRGSGWRHRPPGVCRYTDRLTRSTHQSSCKSRKPTRITPCVVHLNAMHRPLGQWVDSKTARNPMSAS